MASSRAPNGGFASLWALITQSFTVYTSLSLLVFLTPTRMVHLSPARYSKASLVHSSKRFRRTKRAAFSQPWLYVSVPMSSLSDSSPCSDRRKWLKKWRVCFDWHPGDAAQHGAKAWQAADPSASGQAAESKERWCSVFFLLSIQFGTPAHGMAPLRCRLCFPTSLNIIQILPQCD